MPSFKTNMDFVPVSTEFIEKYMVRANGSYVKVYLYASYLAAKNEGAEQAEIASSLNLLESDVKNAFDYWKDEGLISYEGNTIILSNGKKTEELSFSGKKTTAQITRIMSEDESLSGLCQLSQTILGKTINTKDMETLYWMYDELGFAPEVIIMILEYCVSKDKRSVQYAEKVAITWNERGINTIEAVNEHIKNEKERNNYFYSLRKLFGITDRPLSKMEEEYLRKWNEEFNMSEDMVALSYEYCIMQTGKLSFPYMDSILENWNGKNIHDIAAAQLEHESFKSAKNDSNFEVYNDDADHDELEKKLRDKYD